ncbi:MAG: hypothetical protein M3O94_06375 [Actinomycetota bacterium]|nr:hypothetical protein [Actinomycetota bacterium]
MMRRFAVLTLAGSVFVVMLGVATPARASGSTSFRLVLQRGNEAKASTGQTIVMTGVGTFRPATGTASGGGAFVEHLPGQGNVKGTWEAIRTIGYQSFGCGVLFGQPIPQRFCGGVLRLKFVLSTGYEGELAVYCLIGNPPPTAEEGIRVLIPGVGSFSHIVSGDNVYIRTH